MAVEDLGFVLALTGSLSGSVLGFILPAVVSLTLRPLKQRYRNLSKAINVGDRLVTAKKLHDLVMPVFLILFGTSALIFGVVQSIEEVSADGICQPEPNRASAMDPVVFNCSTRT